jgi:O-antigen ligase
MLSSPHLRALVVLIVLAVSTMVLLRWLLKGTELAESFERRRWVWLAATLISFGIPSFYLAFLMLAGLYLWAQKRDPQPIGLYLMCLLAVPPISRDLEGFGPINALFSINNFRLLSIAILLPLAWRLFTAPKPKGVQPPSSSRVTDTAAILYVLYILMLYVPHESVTQLMRRSVHMTLDFLLPYFVITRWLKTRADVKDALAAILVTGVFLAPIAIFEHFKGWLLWGTSAEWWGVPDHFLSLYVYRDSSLRATVSAGHPLVWGHYLVICFGLLTLFRVQFKRLKLVLLWALLALAMYSTISRSPWMSAALVVLLMGLFTGRVVRFYATVATTAVITSAALLASPMADKFINLLPFIGSTDAETIDYREQILETAIIMVKQKPLFGDVHVLENLEHLRQGQGIIDLVNVYAEMAMTIGLVGLGLFLAFLISALGSTLQVCWRSRKKDRELFLMTGAASSALIGSMVLLFAISNYLSVPLTYTALVACMVVTVRLSKLAPPGQATVSEAALIAQGPSAQRGVTVR